MVEIKLTDSRSGKKAPFVPLDPQDVRMYLCGPTVYDRAHLGNARPVVVFDVLYRLLRHVYGDDHVTYVRNFTDVDDKINAAALARQQAGDPRSLEELIAERTAETIGWYHADMDALGALRPAIRGFVSDKAEPRATAYIPQMIAMIETLIARGHAYAVEGHVLFDVRSFPEYGRLSGRSVDDMIAGARVEVAPFKRDPMDFVLWKPSDAETPGWDSPWGRGRPGWHIECSAMSEALLGDSFDIHGGGIDLMFPHHENEIAQSCCARPDAGFASIWLHNEMLQVEGKKMSKSLGNFFTVRDLLEQGVPGEVIRYVFLMTHYRKPMDWTAEKVREATETLKKWRLAVKGVAPSSNLPRAFLAALADDLNTSGAIKIMHDLYAAGKDSAAELRATGEFLSLFRNSDRLSVGDVQKFPEFYSEEHAEFIKTANRMADWFKSDLFEQYQKIGDAFKNINKPVIQNFDALFLKLRSDYFPAAGDAFKAVREFSEKFERELDTALPDLPLSRKLFQKARDVGIADLIAARSAAKKEKRYADADALRNEAKIAGFELIDTPDGTKWTASESTHPEEGQADPK